MTVDFSTGEIVPVLSVTEARHLTDRIRSCAEELWSLLSEAHDRRAWTALGYTTWADYVHTEFSMSRAYAYRVLDQATVIRELSAAAGVSPDGDTPVITEAPARDIKPVLEGVVERVRELRHETPDASPQQVQQMVREVVQAARQPASRSPLPEAFRNAAFDIDKAVRRLESLLDDDRFARNANQVSQLSRGDLIRAADALTGVIQRLPSTN